MLARRYELKFPLDHERKAALLERARHALEPDAHGVDAIYRVSSQYFDTLDYACYREKLDGERVRSKYRLRYYTVEAGCAPPVRDAYFEIKHRINNTVYKERVRLSDEGASAILAAPEEVARLERHLAPGQEARLATSEAIRRAAARPHFGPVEVITYVREAWEGRVDRRLRVTFDSACRALPPGDYLAVAGSGGAPLLPPQHFIAEVKFDHAVPRWMRDIVFELGLKVRRFSKYARGLEALGLVGASRR